MVFNTNIIDLKRLLIVGLFCLPLHESAPTNIDCNGQSFHCLNSTHFMICVDLGGGVSSTVDDFVIPCPPTTICKPTNRFECEFPAPDEVTTEAATLGTTVITTLPWENINSTAAFPKKSLEEHLDLQNSTIKLPNETTSVNDISQSNIYENTSETIVTSVSQSDFNVTTDAIAVETTTLATTIVTNITDASVITITSLAKELTTEVPFITTPPDTTTSDMNSTETNGDITNETTASVAQSDMTTPLVTHNINATELISTIPSTDESKLEVTTATFLATTSHTNSTEINSDITNKIITNTVQNNVDVTTEALVSETTSTLFNNHNINATELYSTIPSTEESKLEVTTETPILLTNLPLDTHPTFDITTDTSISPNLTEVVSGTNTTTISDKEIETENTTEVSNITSPFSTTNNIIDGSQINSDINNEITTSKATTQGNIETAMPFNATDLDNVTEQSSFTHSSNNPNENNNHTDSSDIQTQQNTATTDITYTVIQSTNKTDLADVGVLNGSVIKYTTTETNPATVTIIITENKNVTEKVIDMKPTEFTDATLTTPSDLKFTTFSSTMETIQVADTTRSNESMTEQIKNMNPTEITDPINTTPSDLTYVTTALSATMETTQFMNTIYEGYVTNPISGSIRNSSESKTETISNESSTLPYSGNIESATELTSLAISNITEWIPETTSETVFVVNETYSLPTTPLQSMTTIVDILPVSHTPKTKNEDVTNPYDSDVNNTQTPNALNISTNSSTVQDNVLLTTVLPAAVTDMSSSYTTSRNQEKNSGNSTTALSTFEGFHTTPSTSITNKESNSTANVLPHSLYTEIATEPYNVLNTNLSTEYPDSMVITESNVELSTKSTNPRNITIDSVPFSEISTGPTEETYISTDLHTTAVYTENPYSTIFLTDPAITDIKLESTISGVDLSSNSTTTAIYNEGESSSKGLISTTTEAYNVQIIHSTVADIIDRSTDTTIGTNVQTTKTGSERITTSTSDTQQSHLITNPANEPWTDIDYLHKPATNGPSVLETTQDVIDTTPDYQETTVIGVHATAEFMITETTMADNSIVGSNVIDDKDSQIYSTQPMKTSTETSTHTRNFEVPDTTSFTQTTQATPTEIDISHLAHMDISTQNVLDLGTTAKGTTNKINTTQIERTTNLIPTTTFTHKTETHKPLVTTDHDVQKNTHEQSELATESAITRTNDTNVNKTMPEYLRPGIPTTIPVAIVGYTEPVTQRGSLTTGISPTEAFPTKSSVANSKSETSYIDEQSGFQCKGRKSGRYPDIHDCRKFYTCNGLQVVVDHCPDNTVYSDVKKKCTKDLSHCIRNKEFKCTFNGRYYDYFEPNTYYVCVKNTYTNMYVRFKFQCQNGYHFNKKTVACELNPSVTKVTVPSLKESIKATTEKPNLKKFIDSEPDYECEEEGKFPDLNDCRKYYVCTRILESDEFKMNMKYCDSDEVFHKEKKKCVDDESYECSRAGFSCENRGSGKYADDDDCGKFYTCYGTHLAVRRCPQGTIFSDFKKQCTTDLSHCVRNKQFMCALDGRYYDYFKANMYYVCVKNPHTSVFVQFKFQCQKGYHLDKATAKCEPNNHIIKQSSTDGKVGDDAKKSISKKYSKTKNKPREDFECEKIGRFPDPDDCRKYYVCSRANFEEFRRRRKKCDSDEVFHKDNKECVDAESYEC